MTNDQAHDRPPHTPAADSHGLDDHGVVEPASDLTPEETARELFAHGLLHLLAKRDEAAQQRRIGRVMDAVAAESAGERRHRRTLPRVVRWSLAAAAILSIGTVIVMMGVPGESSAVAAMERTIKAMQHAGDRRYEVRILSWADDQPSDNPLATVDTRSPRLIVINDRPPWSDGPAYVGSDTDGPWAVRNDGSVERKDPFAYWPPWATVDGTSIFAGSVDGLLAELPRTYTLARLAPAALDADAGGPASRQYDRISARRIRLDGHQAHQIDLWIDPDTRLADRIEFRWDPPATSEDEGVPVESGHGPAFRDRVERDHHDHDGPPPGDHGHGQDDAGVRPPPHRGGPGAHLDDGVHRREPGGSRGGRGHPKMVIFQRVDAPQLPENWFSPEGHLK